MRRFLLICFVGLVWFAAMVFIGTSSAFCGREAVATGSIERSVSFFSPGFSCVRSGVNVTQPWSSQMSAALAVSLIALLLVAMFTISWRRQRQT